MFGLGNLSEDALVKFTERLSGALDEIETIRYLLEREYGLVPERDREKNNNNRAVKPFIVDETEIESVKEYDLEKNVNGVISQGVIRNISDNDELKIAWSADQDSAYNTSFTIDNKESFEFEDLVMAKLKIIPVKDTAKFKCVLR